MIDIQIFFVNPFNDEDISINNLISFTRDHLGRMQENNPGGFLTARIAATSAALGAVDVAFQNDLGNLGERKSSKKSKALARRTLVAGAGKIFGVLQYKYGRRSAQLATFFPHGLARFNKMRDDEMMNGWSALIAELSAHTAELGPEPAADAVTLRAGWLAAYEPAQQARGAKTSSMMAKRAARQALQLELCRNLLVIALEFPGQPEKLHVYLRQSLLEPRRAAAKPAPAPVPPGN